MKFVVWQYPLFQVKGVSNIVTLLYKVAFLDLSTTIVYTADMKHLVAITILCALALSGIIIATNTEAKTQAPYNYMSICDNQTYAAQVHCSTNYERGEAGKEPLKVSNELMEVSRQKSEHMCENNYLSHDYLNRKWTYYIEKSGLNYSKAGENLARGFNKPEKTVNALINSPTHRDNILGDYNYLGGGR